MFCNSKSWGGRGTDTCTVCFQHKRPVKKCYQLEMVEIDVDSVQPPFYVDLFYQTHFFFNTNHCMNVELVQQQTWIVGSPVCFILSFVIHTCLDILVFTRARSDTYIRKLLFLEPAWMIAAFPQTPITSPEVAIWWSSCQVYSYPHSSNNPFFISLLVF